jgi:hypothetical protein
MRHHKVNAEQHADLVIREVVATTEMPALLVGLMAKGWAVDAATDPGTLSASKGNGRLFYPGGVGGRWDIVISEMRPADPTADPLTGDVCEAIAWQTALTQSAPLDIVLSIAELAAGDAQDVVDEVREMFRNDGIDNPDGDGEACTGR